MLMVAILLLIRELMRSSNGAVTALAEVIVIFLSPFRKTPGQYFKLGHDRFRPHPFQSIIDFSSYHLTLYDQSY
jgi:hypothetical protein